MPTLASTFSCGFGAPSRRTRDPVSADIQALSTELQLSERVGKLRGARGCSESWFPVCEERSCGYDRRGPSRSEARAFGKVDGELRGEVVSSSLSHRSGALLSAVDRRSFIGLGFG